MVETSWQLSNNTAAGDDDDDDKVRFRKTLVFPINLNDRKETAERGERGEREGCCSSADDEDDENDNSGDDDMFSRHEHTLDPYAFVECNRLCTSCATGLTLASSLRLNPDFVECPLPPRCQSRPADARPCVSKIP